ncbi:hypothetical protein [Methanoculleus chikugoensis]|uniref:hypothetical protein n=1 Tax=Methanoculleus chikugoensis TaxID=118126 RepID=UPI000AA0A893|nr:hypothetical protein [Methanoculleus chikugoensis]
MTGTRIHLSALSLAVAGACFFAYPAIRPYTDEASLAGAGAFASPPAWLLSHTLAMVGSSCSCSDCSASTVPCARQRPNPPRASRRSS